MASSKNFEECVDISSDEESVKTSDCVSEISEESQSVVNHWWEEHRTLFDCPKVNLLNVWDIVFTEPKPQTHYSVFADRGGVYQLPPDQWKPIPQEADPSRETPIPEEVAVEYEASSVGDLESAFDSEEEEEEEEEDLRKGFQGFGDLRCEEKCHPNEDMDCLEYLNRELKIFENKTNEYSPLRDVGDGSTEKKKKIKKRKEMPPMANNILEFIVQGRTSAKAKDILFGFKNFGVVHVKPQWVGGQFPLWAYYSIIAKQEVRDQVLEEMKRERIPIDILPENYCSLCYSRFHTHKDCKGCNVCLSNQHQFRQCRYWTGGQRPIRKTEQDLHPLTLLRRQKREQLNTPSDRFWNSAPIFDQPIGLGPVKEDWEEAAIDVEKSMSSNGLVPIQVVINVWIQEDQIGSQTRFFADINTSNEIINLMDKYSGGNPSDVKRGIVLLSVKQRVLQICSGKTLYCFDGRHDLECLGITAKDVFDKKIHVIDIQRIPRHMDGNQKISLKDMFYAYFNNRIQEYDRKPRPMGGHNIEIDARSTLKIAVKYRKNLKTAIWRLRHNLSLTPGFNKPLNYYQIKDKIIKAKERGHLPSITMK